MEKVYNFETWEEAQAFLASLGRSGDNQENGEVLIEEAVTLKKFDGDLTPEEMEVAEPVETIEINNIIRNGELISSTRKEVK